MRFSNYPRPDPNGPLYETEYLSAYPQVTKDTVGQAFLYTFEDE
jgi:hypothetical protein